MWPPPAMPAGTFPSRYTHLAALRALHGDLVDRFGRWLGETDARADAVVEAFERLPRGEGPRQLELALREGIDAVPEPVPALVALFAQLDEVPVWVDWQRLRLGAEVYRRSGLFAQSVLVAASLPKSYASPVGNKPLVLTARLVEDATQRLADTGRFVVAVVAPDGLRPGREGRAALVRVRLLHARVRVGLRRSDKWQPAWGVPINQADMVATSLVFSHTVVDGLDRLGLRLTHDEREAVIHLWRYAGYLIGVDPSLQPATFDEGTRLWKLIEGSNDAPDDDSRALTRALLDVSPKVLGIDGDGPLALAARGFFEGLTRYLCGDALADQLGVPRTRWRHSARLYRTLARQLDRARRHLPLGDRIAVAAGSEIWRRSVARAPVRAAHG